MKRHPFTGANPGGFGWSDLSGAVPDADDTPGAILALCRIKAPWPMWGHARNWLRDIQNKDGGWPTFCRGWGRLPFDRSGTDLTAHAIRAFRTLSEPKEILGEDYFERLYGQCVDKGFSYLARTQNPDGSWSPLWFGNQDHAQEDNPVYGTAKVLMAYRDLGMMDSPEARRGVAWLVANQNADGGWGSGVWGRFQISDFRFQISDKAERSGEQRVQATESPPMPSNLKSEILNLKSSVEETALAVEALLAACPPTTDHRPPTNLPARNATEGVPYSAVHRGLNWLIDRVEAGQHWQPAPIGFYFAKLWYYERLYPLTFAVAALGRACRQFAPAVQHDSTADPHAHRAT